MNRSLKRTAMIVVAVLAMLIGVTVAIATAAGSGHPPRPRHAPRARAVRRSARLPAAGGAANPLADAARYLGVAPAALRAELGSGESLAQIAEATPGKSVSGLTAALLAPQQARLDSQLAGTVSASKQQSRLAALTQRTTERVSRPGRTTVESLTSAAARYLGTSRRALRTDLRGGESLAQLAEASPGKSTNGLIEAIVAAQRARLETHLAKGNISRAQEQSLLAGLPERVAAAVQTTRAPHP